MFNFLKGIYNKMFNTKSDIEKLINKKMCYSSKMYENINLWLSIWKGKAYWNDKNTISCGILSTIASKLSSQVGEEVNVFSEDEHLNEIMQDLNNKLHYIVESMTATGGAIIRPFYENSKLSFEVVIQGNFYPISFDSNGVLTGAVFYEKYKEKDYEFVRIEEHEYKDNQHIIRNTAYKKNSYSTFVKVNLNSIDKWENLEEEYVFNNCEKPLIVYFKPKIINKIDFSYIGVSLICDCVDLIKQADKQYSRMEWEQEGGELAVDVESTHLIQLGKKDETIKLPKGKERLFRMGSFNENEDSYRVFSPKLRTAEQDLFFQIILKRIELVSGIGKGIISDLEEIEQTATQYRGGQKNFYSMVDMIESEIEEKYKHCAYVFSVYLFLFENKPLFDEIKVTFNNSDRIDPLKKEEFKSASISNINQLLAGEIISKDEARKLAHEALLLPKDSDVKTVVKNNEDFLKEEDLLGKE